VIASNGGNNSTIMDSTDIMEEIMVSLRADSSISTSSSSAAAAASDTYNWNSNTDIDDDTMQIYRSPPSWSSMPGGTSSYLDSLTS
jgi:hypothetical protein